MSIISDIFAGGIEGITSSLTKAIQTFKADATQQAQLDAAVEQTKLAIVQLGMQADMAAQAAVNQAMQAEAKSEHWLQWSWRPLAAYIVYAVVLNNYILAPYLSKYGVIYIPIPDSLYMMFMAILGVTAWHRGVAQVEQARMTNGNGAK